MDVLVRILCNILDILNKQQIRLWHQVGQLRYNRGHYNLRMSYEILFIMLRCSHPKNK
jgi:hypothetical protein